MNFSTETIISIISGIGASLSILGGVIALLSKSKSKKARTIAESMNKVYEFCKDAVILAEQFLNFTGKEKKEYATTLVKQCCIEEGIKINNEEISGDIEDIIKISKVVNNNRKGEKYGKNNI